MSLYHALYRGATTLALPALHHWLARREARGKEDAQRLQERFGYASLARPAGKLIWVHAASVGEVMSTLLLLQKLAERLPQAHFLITSGTVTSARLVAGRLPPRARHQFVPLDVPSCVARFMAHWQPDMALWLESELWPNLLAALRQRHVPSALLNARLSARSQRHWRFAKGWIAEMLNSFALCLSQTASGAAELQALGAKHTAYYGNLKFAALPLPDQLASRTELQATLGDRPVWLFASSHAGEEEIALAAHKMLRQKCPTLLLVLVPRHPARGAALMQLIAASGEPGAQRSLAQLPDAACTVYLADTLGELGVWYRLCPVSIVGGSFVPVGGHNPIEPALLGTAIGFGRLMPNFSEVAAAMLAAQAATELADAAAIAAFVSHMLQDVAARTAQTTAALAYATAQGAVHDKVIAALAPLFTAAQIAGDTTG
jgi:3-deoxy-D-manno-octulosonic-acid transferase